MGLDEASILMSGTRVRKGPAAITSSVQCRRGTMIHVKTARLKQRHTVEREAG